MTFWNAGTNNCFIVVSCKINDKTEEFCVICEECIPYLKKSRDVQCKVDDIAYGRHCGR